MLLKYFLLSMVAEAGPAFAVPGVAVSAASVTSLAGAVQMVLALAAVLAVIFALAWMSRRVRGLQGGSDRPLQLRAQLRIGEKENVVLVALGEQQWLLGVSTGQVTLLHHFPSGATELPVTDGGRPPIAASFAQQLRASLGFGK